VPKEEKQNGKAADPELKELQGYYDLMLEKGLDALELKDADSRIRLTRRFAAASGPVVMAHHSPSARVVEREPVPEEPPAASAEETIPTPLSGVFYRSSSPTSAPFVKEGDAVEPGQTLCIVEAMKVMNEIKAEARCRIVKILVENGRPVTAAQPLFQMESA
jgi:acetyl-CoA carboxylase biotin carboxyl carrier protein